MRSPDPQISVVSRRSVLKTGLAGLAGLGLADLVRSRAFADEPSRRRSVILLWMTGGPSHIDLWDVKPHAPREIRGPFSPISTALPGAAICEHLPKQAAMLDRFTILRAVDSSASNHEPNMVMQTANLKAEPRVNPEAARYPALASAIARFRGPNVPGLPPYVAYAADRSHLAWGGYLGLAYDPLMASPPGLGHTQPFSELSSVSKAGAGHAVAQKFQLATGLSHERLYDRSALLDQMDRIRTDLDLAGSMAALDQFERQAIQMVTGGRAIEAFDLSREPAAAHALYGEHPWCQQALLARRLVESGVNFVTLSLSPYTASGAWDNHGDDVVYFGIEKGLKPLLPPFDHLLTTLVADLEQRGLLDDTLVLAMGEFGRSPRLTKDGGRDHWQPVMSMSLAGGGLRHGQVIGSTDRQGGAIQSRPVRPGDIAAMIFRHMEVPLEATYVDHNGRPRRFIDEGEPIAELI